MRVAFSRENIVLVVIFSYLLLNLGVMQIRVPGLQAPIGELLIVFFLVSLNDARWLQDFKRSIFLLPFVIWWVLGLTRSGVAVFDHGVWALRDASQVIDSLYLWIGFVLAGNPAFIKRLFKFLPWLLLAICLYALTYPFRETLLPLSPTVTALAGYSSPIFFHYQTTAVMVEVAAAYLLLFDGRLSTSVRTFLAALILGYVVVLFQARTIYLQIFAIFFLLFLFRRTAFLKMSFAGAITLTLMAVVLAMGLRIEGRLGQEFSFEFLGNHLLAIFGIAEEGVGAAAQGVQQRFGWWERIWNDVTSTNTKFLFGLGYGFPLVDFAIASFDISTIVVREPHNSYLSVFARIGLIGFLAFAWMHVLLAHVWLKAYRLCKEHGDEESKNRLLLLAVYFSVVMIYAMGEDAFEKPYNAIPYYFFWGVVLHYYQHLKRAVAEMEAGAAVPQPA